MLEGFVPVFGDGTLPEGSEPREPTQGIEDPASLGGMEGDGARAPSDVDALWVGGLPRLNLDRKNTPSRRNRSRRRWDGCALKDAPKATVRRR
jgi:hypothetical protein